MLRIAKLGTVFGRPLTVVKAFSEMFKVEWGEVAASLCHIEGDVFPLGDFKSRHRTPVGLHIRHRSDCSSSVFHVMNRW